MGPFHLALSIIQPLPNAHGYLIFQSLLESNYYLCLLHIKLSSYSNTVVCLFVSQHRQFR